MFELYSFFKDPLSGGVYAVSPRVIAGGFVPAEDHIEASQEERNSFIQRAVDGTTSANPKTEEDLQVIALDLRDQGYSLAVIAKLVGVDLDALESDRLEELDRIRAQRAPTPEAAAPASPPKTYRARRKAENKMNTVVKGTNQVEEPKKMVVADSNRVEESN